MEFQRLLDVWLLESNTPVGRVHADRRGVLPILRARTTGFSHRVGGRLPSEAKPKRFTYTDSNGREAPIYLRLDQVSAIIVTPAGTSTSEGGPSRAPESRAPELGELRL